MQCVVLIMHVVGFVQSYCYLELPTSACLLPLSMLLGVTAEAVGHIYDPPPIHCSVEGEEVSNGN